MSFLRSSTIRRLVRGFATLRLGRLFVALPELAAGRFVQPGFFIGPDALCRAWILLLVARRRREALDGRFICRWPGRDCCTARQIWFSRSQRPPSRKPARFSSTRPSVPDQSRYAGGAVSAPHSEVTGCHSGSPTEVRAKGRLVSFDSALALRRQMLERIDGIGAAANLEMELR